MNFCNVIIAQLINNKRDGNMVRCKHIRVGAKYNITRLILKQTRKAKNTKKRRVENIMCL